jgi:hypothetical protein
MSRIIEAMIAAGMVAKIGNGGRGGYAYAINRDRTAELIGDYIDTLERAA